jgi:chaperonin GroEL (HSP60 family)
LFFLFIDISKVQDDEVGDGTTSVVVLASELLRVNIPLKSFSDPFFLSDYL